MMDEYAAKTLKMQTSLEQKIDDCKSSDKSLRTEIRQLKKADPRDDALIEELNTERDRLDSEEKALKRASSRNWMTRALRRMKS